MAASIDLFMAFHILHHWVGFHRKSERLLYSTTSNCYVSAVQMERAATSLFKKESYGRALEKQTVILLTFVYLYCSDILYND